LAVLDMATRCCAHKLLLFVRLSRVAGTVYRRTEIGIRPGGFTHKTGLNLAHKLMSLVFVAIKVKLILARDEIARAVGFFTPLHTLPRDATTSVIRVVSKKRSVLEISSHSRRRTELHFRKSCKER
jgi:hypothetical protein